MKLSMQPSYAESRYPVVQATLGWCAAALRSLVRLLMLSGKYLLIALCILEGLVDKILNWIKDTSN